MKKYIASLSLYFVPFIVAAQTTAQHTASEKTTGAAVTTAAFPVSFEGRWKGTLQWIRAGKPTQSFTMQLYILPADTSGQYSWQIIYGDNEKDNRPYLLKPVDTAAGHWVVDEKDGIVLDSYVHGNCLQGAFTVEGNTIVDNYCMEAGKMKVEFFSIRLNDAKQSGKGTGQTPFVYSYTINSYQTGVLTRLQ